MITYSDMDVLGITKMTTTQMKIDMRPTQMMTNNELIALIVATAVQTGMQLSEVAFDVYGVMWRYDEDIGGGRLTMEDINKPVEFVQKKVRGAMSHYKSRYGNGNI